MSAVSLDAPAVPLCVALGSFVREETGPLHLLIREARAGRRDAVDSVLLRLEAVAGSLWPALDDVVTVPVPGHLPGSTPALVIEAAQALARTRRWAYADAIRRRQPGPEAKQGPPRDPAREAEALEWLPPREGATVVLVDDVVRGGSTLLAVRAAIRAAADQRPVVAVALARALPRG